MAVGVNMMMMFYNLSTNDEIIYRAFGGDVGEGVHRLTGHKLYNIFAFAESAVTPRIFIKTYPEFRSICTLASKF